MAYVSTCVFQCSSYNVFSNIARSPLYTVVAFWQKRRIFLKSSQTSAKTIFRQQRHPGVICHIALQIFDKLESKKYSKKNTYFDISLINYCFHYAKILVSTSFPCRISFRELALKLKFSDLGALAAVPVFTRPKNWQKITNVGRFRVISHSVYRKWRKVVDGSRKPLHRLLTNSEKEKTRKFV